jgi:ABC-2 type transport system permease protein
MRDALHLYCHYLRLSLRAQMQYRASFVLATLSQLLVTSIEFLGVWALFSRFGTLRGWTLPEVALFYGLVNVAFALADAFSRGFDMFSYFIKHGEFDRLLLRPRSTILQLAGHELALKKLGRLAQGAAVLGWAMASVDGACTPAHVALLTAALAGAVCLFFGLMILQATLTFWTIEGLEITNTVTYGGVDAMQYPLAIYHRYFQRFFTYVVPLACVCYYPVLTVLGKSADGVPPWLGWVSPVAGVAFLALSQQVWQIGVRHYRSTGS